MMKYAFYIGFFIALSLAGVGLALVLLGLMGCQTPYGVLSADAIESYVSHTEGLVCLSDGFDEICIKTIPGEDGRDGAVVLLEVEKVIVETEREVLY